MKRIAGTPMRGLLAALVLSVVLGAGVDLSAQIRPDVERLLDEGYSLFSKNDLNGAQQKFEKALMLDVTSSEAFEWVEKVGYAQLIAALDAGNASLASQVSTLMNLTSTVVKERLRDPARIDAALAAYFGATDRLAQTKAEVSAVNTHGVYLLPGLMARAAEADQPTRVKAILATVRIDADAVLPLCRALHSGEIRQVQAAIGALEQIGHKAGIPSLLQVAETHGDSVVRQAAREAAQSLGAPAGMSAYDALTAEASRFYNDSNYMNRTYHDPVIWTMTDGALSWTEVDGWALNELRAAQLIEDALSLDAGADGMAQRLKACNNLARFAEWRDVLAAMTGKSEAGEVSESAVAELRAREGAMEMVKSEAYMLPEGTLLAATGLALDQDRPLVAIELLGALRSFLVDGTRAQAVPPVLSRALGFDDRGVRFAAAEYLAFMNPRAGFAGADRVVDELAVAINSAGRRVALTVFPNDRDAMLVSGLLENAHIDSFNDNSAIGALDRATSFPKDLIVVAPGLTDMPTAELIRRLRKHYITKTTPIIVMSDEGSFAENEATYGNAEDGIWVVSRGIDPLRMRDDLLSGMLSDEWRERDEALAANAAEALRYLSARETAFNLGAASDALVQALKHPSDSVRLPTCRAIASLGIDGASAALVQICQQGDANSVQLRAAAFKTLGQIHRDGNVSPAVKAVIEEGSQSSEVEIQRSASRARGAIGPSVFRD
ncbi:MAG: HEAT repeat domain-containing protein [Planctomycetota bacterium]